MRERSAERDLRYWRTKPNVMFDTIGRPMRRTEEAVMKTLLAVLAAIGAAVIALVFLRRREGSWSSAADTAKDTATSWGKSAADESNQAADTVAATAQGATDAASTVADKVAATAAGATDAASTVAGEVASAAEGVADAASTAADHVKSKVREAT
jgi:hypothetical protein